MSHHASPLCQEPRSLSGLLRSSATRDGPRLPGPLPPAWSPRSPSLPSPGSAGPWGCPGMASVSNRDEQRWPYSRIQSLLAALGRGCSQEKRVEQRQFRGLGLGVTGSLRAARLLTLNPGSAHDMRGLALFFLEAKVPWQESLPLVSQLWAPWQPEERF